MMVRLEKLVAGRVKLIMERDDNVKTLASTGEQLSREEVDARHSSRGVPEEEVEEEGVSAKTKEKLNLSVMLFFIIFLFKNKLVNRKYNIICIEYKNNQFNKHIN